MIKSAIATESVENISEKILFILFTLYITSVVMFSRPDNVIMSNLANVVLVAYFVLHQLFFTAKKVYFNSVLHAYLVFILFAMLSVSWTIDFSYSSYTVVRLIQIFINLVIIYNITKIYKFHEAFFIGFMIATLLNTLMATGIIHPNFPIYFGGGARFMGTTINPNIMGGMMLFSLMGSILFLQYTKNKLWIIANIMNILLAYYITLLTVSRTSLIVSSGILAVYVLQLFLARNTRGYLFFFVLIGVALMFFLVDLDALMVKVEFAIERIGFIFEALSGNSVEHSADERLEFVKIALGVFGENPFFGTGINTMRVFLGGVYSHNNYVELLANVGLVGTTIYYAMYMILILKVISLKDIWLKTYLLLFIFAILLFDLAGVTYYTKQTLMMLLLFSYIVEINIKSFQENDDVELNNDKRVIL